MLVHYDWAAQASAGGDENVHDVSIKGAVQRIRSTNYLDHRNGLAIL